MKHPHDKPSMAQTIAQQKEERKKRARRTTWALIAAIIVVLIVIIALISVVVTKAHHDEPKGTASSSSQSQTVTKEEAQKRGYLTGNTATALAAMPIAQQVTQGEGVLVSAQGVGHASANVPTVELYYSYSCPGCLSVEHENGDAIEQLATSGKVNLVLHPVSTHAMPWTYIAADAALTVARQQPEKFWDFHRQLMEHAYQVMYVQSGDNGQSQGLNGPLSKADESLDLVRQVATQVGIKKKLIDGLSISDQDSSPITQWSNDWYQAAQSQGEVYTPMMARDGLVLPNFLAQDGTLDVDTIIGK